MKKTRTAASKKKRKPVAKTVRKGLKKTPKKVQARTPKKALPKKASPKKGSPKKTSEKTMPQTAKKRERTKAATSKTAARTAAPGLRSKPKALPRDFLVNLAAAIRDAVLPAVQAAKGREVIGQAVSGDATFELDRIAEKALHTFLKQAKLPVAYYSEDEGYATFSSAQPQNLLIVDPIDGTRAAKSGFEGCVVAVASTRVIERPRVADIDTSCVMEILGNRVFYAARGKGVRIYADGHVRRPKLSKNTNLETVSWAMTVPGRPAELIFPTAAKLIDLTSLKGGFFACNSTSFSLTRLLTNQLDAYVDFANRFLRDIPEHVRDHFINAGRGTVLGIAPYDVAASLLIAREAGCFVTDAYGQGLDEVMLLDSGESNHRSMIAAANAELHEKLMSFFETRITQFESLLKRHAELAG